MSMMYATVTSKGQVTLPVGLRRALGIEPGQTVGFRRSGDQVVMETAAPVDAVRDMIEQAARRNGTWGKSPDLDALRREAAVGRYADA